MDVTSMKSFQKWVFGAGIINLAAVFLLATALLYRPYYAPFYNLAHNSLPLSLAFTGECCYNHLRSRGRSTAVPLWESPLAGVRRPVAAAEFVLSEFEELVCSALGLRDGVGGLCLAAGGGGWRWVD